MSDDNMHDVVKLLLARMESHPEEFDVESRPNEFDVDLPTLFRSGRWYGVLARINPHLNGAEEAALKGKIRDMALTAAHEAAMDELLNGPARREEAERALNEKIQAAAQQQLAAQRPQYAGTQQQLAAQLQPSPWTSATGSYAPTPGIHAPTPATSGSLRIDGETLDASTLRKIKRKLGL